MILFIDDEPRYVDAYQRDLEESGYQVTLITHVDEALSFLSVHQNLVELVILDIMMPAGRIFRDTNTEKGRHTGVFLYRELRRLSPNVPFIILTNVSNPDLEKIFEGESRCRFMHKYEYLPHEVTDGVQKFLTR